MVKDIFLTNEIQSTSAIVNRNKFEAFALNAEGYFTMNEREEEYDDEFNDEDLDNDDYEKDEYDE